MDDVLIFPDRGAFHEWLLKNGQESAGVWLLFGKRGGPMTISAGEALEEALCFGWIDGRMQSLDQMQYKKYFARRTPQSSWSEKNKALVADLEKQGRLTDAGREKIAEAKRNGRWHAPKPPAISEEHIDLVSSLLENHEPAYTNFLAMSPSIKKTYAKAYLNAKTDAGKESRLAWMIDRLDKNLKPL